MTSSWFAARYGFLAVLSALSVNRDMCLGGGSPVPPEPDPVVDAAAPKGSGSATPLDASPPVDAGKVSPADAGPDARLDRRFVRARSTERA
jgi:hypothetical protein